MIKEITFEECCTLWRLLWPHKPDAIEATSRMNFPGQEKRNSGIHSIVDEDQVGEPIFLGYYMDDVLAGVNSLHPLANTTRSRGLFVLPEYRRHGIGVAIMKETINRATGIGVWSFPKETALNTYLKAGFELASIKVPGEVEGTWNYYVKKML